MFEDKTYEELLQEKLDMVDTSFDKREGSILYDALAPNSAELAMMYIQLNWVFQQMFGDTADREYLVKIAKDTRGLEPTQATNAVLKGQFNIEVEIGARFNLDTLNYCVVALIDNGLHTYQVKCETTGIEGNQHLGTLIPINYIAGLTACELTEVLIPGEDEEDTEVFRKRWCESFDSTAFGGNRADYIEKVNTINGVGGCKCYRTTNEAGESVGGHVKCVIITTDYASPTSELIAEVQKMIDPTGDMEGNGLAPIGHIAHVQGVKETIINISSTITYEGDITYIDLKSQIEAAVSNYFKTLSETWENSNNLVVRISQIESAILLIDGIQDITNTLLNDTASNITLYVDAIPVRGEIVG